MTPLRICKHPLDCRHDVCMCDFSEPIRVCNSCGATMDEEPYNYGKGGIYMCFTCYDYAQELSREQFEEERREEKYAARQERARQERARQERKGLDY